jgi:uncharacterized protein YqeY
MTLKDQLRADLTAAIKASETLRRDTLRMVLAAITTEEVAGTTSRELDDRDIVTVLQREVKKRAESAEAFSAGGRSELAQKERAESAVIAEYLPQQLTDDELGQLVEDVIAEAQAASGERPSMKQMGSIIKATAAKAAGQADGRRISAAVKEALTS